MNPLARVLSAGQKRKVRRLHGLVAATNSFEEEIKTLTDAELRAKTDVFRKRYADGEALDDLLPEAFACVREAGVRTLNQRHFDVQIMGGIVLHQGRIAEMKTGEGKTLVATLPAFLNAISGKGVHVVTVNDYLARRDSEWMGTVYRALGLSVGAIQMNMPPEIRKPIYSADITYGTNSEFGFDYLRDNMADHPDQLVQRGHNYAIVDEVDSILIDEARTPLIISGAAEESAKWYYQFANIVRRLQRDRDYEVDESKRTCSVTEDGVHHVEQALGVQNLYDEVSTPLVHYLNAAIKAKEIYKRDVEYIVKDGEVIIVDEFTGRQMPGRRWSDGIHQSVEAKEGVRIKEEHQTLATITIQNYFRMYDKLAGMTGTAMTESAEFDHIYKLEVVQIPTNRPMIRADHDDLIYKTEEAKFVSVVEDIKEHHEKGQPVLVGTVSIEKNERLSRLLERQGIPHAVLNAKNHEKEAMIIAQAGHAGAVTVATNMAGRGVDIILGGNLEYRARAELLAEGLEFETPEFDAEAKRRIDGWRDEWQKEHEHVVSLGGLYVLGTERHESRRIDNQLRGRGGRQGDPGDTRFYLSLADDLMQRFAANRVGAIMDRLNIPEDVPIEHKLVSRAIRNAQKQVEQQNFEARKNVLKYDDVLNTQREVIYGERKKILEGEDLTEQAISMVEDVVTAIVDTFCPEGVFEEEWDLSGLLTAVEEIYPTKLTKEDVTDLDYGHLIEKVLTEAHAAYAAKEAELTPDIMRQAERIVMLRMLDAAWRDHLYEMDYLQEGIHLRAMAQRDPLVEYQREGYELFQGMLGRIKDEFAKYIFHVRPVAAEEPQPTRARQPLTYTSAPKEQPLQSQIARPPAATPQAAAAAAQQGGNGDAPAYQTVRREGAAVGRNDPCPCGSGKKYKKCHGLVA
jgi:preprotein translocase subunit SecA